MTDEVVGVGVGVLQDTAWYRLDQLVLESPAEGEALEPVYTSLYVHDAAAAPALAQPPPLVNDLLQASYYPLLAS